MDGLKSDFNAFRRKPLLGAPDKRLTEYMVYSIFIFSEYNITCPIPENEPFDDITWLVMKDAAPSQNIVVTKSSKPHSTVKFGYIVNKRSTFFNVTVSPIVLSFES